MQNEITIDGKKYVLASSVKNSPAKSVKGMKYCLVRGIQSGVYAGYVKSHEGQQVVLVNARNLWYWKGASALAQLSQEGVKNPADCKFTVRVPEQTLTDVCQIVECSQEAMDNIEAVPEWKQ